jgi:predicted nucleotidyltransferase
MIQANGLKKEEQNKIIGLCKAILPDCTIWLYGSRARGDFKANSDIDLALDCTRAIDLIELSELKEVLNATNIFLKIDLADLSSINDHNFLKSILKERVLWKD